MKWRWGIYTGPRPPTRGSEKAPKISLLWEILQNGTTEAQRIPLETLASRKPKLFWGIWNSISEYTHLYLLFPYQYTSELPTDFIIGRKTTETYPYFSLVQVIGASNGTPWKYRTEVYPKTVIQYLVNYRGTNYITFNSFWTFRRISMLFYAHSGVAKYLESAGLVYPTL